MTSESEPYAPQVPEDGELSELELEALVHDGELSGFSADDCQVPERQARGLIAEGGAMRRVDLSSSVLDNGRFTDLVLTQCNLSNLRSRASNLTRVGFQGCRLTGMSLTDSVLHDVTFRDCRVDLSSFALSRLKRVRFEGCHLVGISLMEASCEAVRFEGCEMTNCDLRGASLAGCEFSGTDLAGVEGIEGLRGARFEWGDIIQMAGVWAAALGIELIASEEDDR